MGQTKTRRPKANRAAEDLPFERVALEVYRATWTALRPAERLRRSWRLRARLKDIEAVQDEKSLAKL